MLTGAYFTELVKKAYLFLELDFNFNYIDTIDHPRLITVRYIKNELASLIIYSRANDYVEVRICDHASILEPPNYFKYCVMLMGILRDENPDFDYNSIMPSKIPLEESVKQTAALLKYYGAGMLSGEEPIKYKK